MAAGIVPPLGWWARFGYGTVGALGPELIRWVEILRGPVDPNVLTNLPFFAALFLVLVLVSGVFAAAWHDNSPVKCIYFGATFPAFISSISALAPALPGR
jgi:hypothetical protein